MREAWNTSRLWSMRPIRREHNMKKKMKNSAFIVMVISLLSFPFLLLMISASHNLLWPVAWSLSLAFCASSQKALHMMTLLRMMMIINYIALADLKGVKIAAIVEHLFSWTLCASTTAPFQAEKLRIIQDCFHTILLSEPDPAPKLQVTGGLWSYLGLSHSSSSPG